MNLRDASTRSKAVLKPPQSRRYRVRHVFTNLAKRLDCGAFTAALEGRFSSHSLPSLLLERPFQFLHPRPGGR